MAFIRSEHLKQVKKENGKKKCSDVVVYVKTWEWRMLIFEKMYSVLFSAYVRVISVPKN